MLKTDVRLFTSTIDANWVRQLEYDDDFSERLDAFVSRFGRMQDTLGNKLLPSLLRLLAEKPGSTLDNLNKAEKLGLLASVMQWLDVSNKAHSGIPSKWSCHSSQHKINFLGSRPAPFSFRFSQFNCYNCQPFLLLHTYT